jgi:predicted component of type VI protein secretion system
MVRDSQQHTSRGLHVISLAEKVLKLGRGHESDVRIADVSISRCHATIRFHRGQFLLEDNNSKFGTLVALKKPRPLEAGTPISIQMGRTVVSLTMQAASEMHGQQNQVPPLQHPGSTAEDERALRLSLLNRGSAPEDVDFIGVVGNGAGSYGRWASLPSAVGQHDSSDEVTQQAIV